MEEESTEEKPKRGRPPVNKEPLVMSKRDYRAVFVSNSLGQRIPADAVTQSLETYQSVMSRDYDNLKKDFVLRTVASNAGRPMAAHSLVNEAERYYSAFAKVMADG